MGIAVAAIGTTSLAGCSGLLRSSTDVTHEQTVGPSTPSMSKRELNRFVAEQEQKYADAGVWGTSRTEPNHDLDYVGSWRTSKPVLPKSDGKNANEGLAALDGVIVLYRIPGKRSEDDEQHYQFWLWSAVRPLERASGEGDGPTFTHLGTRVGFDDSGYRMLAYSPATDASSGPVSVAPQSPGVNGLSAEFPLDRGTVEFDSDTRVGEHGLYGVEWNGDRTGTQSLNATFEASWPVGRERDFDWNTRLTVGESAF